MIYEYVLICCLDFSFLPLPPSFPLPWFCFDTVLFFDLWWTIKEMQPTSLQSVLLLWLECFELCEIVECLTTFGIKYICTLYSQRM